jgi:IS605 OrfB family transposase
MINMADAITLPTTQRAYTLRLRGINESDPGWREALWATHEAVNRGAKVFGDWLLTLRGGLCHRLATLDIPEGKGGKIRAPNIQEVTDHRIVLALSWLSVESKVGAPNDEYVVPANQTMEALRGILKERRLRDDEIEAWIGDCRECLNAAIRPDAVWVNRSKAFDHVYPGLDNEKSRQDAHALLWHLFGRDYLALSRKMETGKKADGKKPAEEQVLEDNRGAVIQSGKGAAQRTRHPFSHVFGDKSDSKGFGNPVCTLQLRQEWRQCLMPQIEKASGIPLWDTKKRRKKGEGRAPTELHREMFSKAASRLAQIHTKQKQQEVERQQRMAADSALKDLEADPAFHDALTMLQRYCQERAEESGALGAFLVRPRQIDQWDRVVAAWSAIEEPDPLRAAEGRIDAAKRLQDELRDEKFGDINLFIAFAAEERKRVWCHDAKPNAAILRTYVRGQKARADAVRLKVAAYRHPDPYFNPIFCQFGVSRPQIDFRRLKDFTPAPACKDMRSVRMLLWDGENADLRILLATSKRLDAEIGSAGEAAIVGGTGVAEVPRRSRLAIAAVSGNNLSANYRVGHVFDRQKVKPKASGDQGEDAQEEDAAAEGKAKEPEWNGTLQTDRRMLERIGRAVQCDPAIAKKLERQLRWWLIVSLELEPRGPWLAFARQNVIPLDQRSEVTVLAPRNARDEWRGLAYPFWHPDNEQGRKGMAKHVLSRLPAGLRVLSVDLGHRYAAACAVWETLSLSQIEAICAAAGQQLPGEDALCVRIQHERKTTICRRIGPNRLGTDDYRAPWARLERQFLLTLQGEEREARGATSEERESIEKLEHDLGFSRTEKRKATAWRVDKVMADAVRTAELGLRRHSQRSRIAFYLTAPGKPRPSGGLEPFDEKGRLESLREDVLLPWCDLATGRRWKDPSAADAWQEFVVDRLQGPTLPERAEEEDAQSWRKRLTEFSPSLEEVARKLAANQPLRERIRADWVTHWLAEDGQPAETCDETDPGGKKTGSTFTVCKSTGWHLRLRQLTDWILGYRKDRTIRDTGGLSLTRVATLKALYQLQKAFRMRPHPDNPRRNIPGKDDDTLREFGQHLLDALEHLRDNRVKQLASRIAAAALGLAHAKPLNPRNESRVARRQRLTRLEHRFAVCHAVVIENLTNYRPEETRTRRENRQLMSWASAKVKKYLAEACQLHGLHLREVSARYTSRQDSRTGAPGIRCQDIPVADFVRCHSWISKQVRIALDKPAHERTALDRYLVAHWVRWDDSTQRWHDFKNVVWELGSQGYWVKKGEDHIDPKRRETPAPLRIPSKSGEIFVSAKKDSPAAMGLQADLNAAANIGLRALLDPDWTGRWWYVPCDPVSHLPVEMSTKGSAVFESRRPFPTSQRSVLGEQSPSRKTKQKGRGQKKGEENDRPINLWRDVSATSLYDGSWRGIQEYENTVRGLVIRILREQANLSPTETAESSADNPF